MKTVDMFTDDEFNSDYFVECSAGHYVLDFLACDPASGCDTTEYQPLCQSQTVSVLMFKCQGSDQTLHYSFVCDRRQQCPDNSDEDFCQFAACPEGYFQCLDGGCVSGDKHCDDRLRTFHFMRNQLFK